MKAWLSRYSMNYPRTLIYMLQESGYYLFEYLEWYRRTPSFENVEKRKKFVSTPKSLLLLGLCWLLVGVMIFLAIISLFVVTFPFSYVVFVGLLLGIPYILPYAMVVLLWAVKMLVQAPIQFFIFRKTRKILRAHPALKIGIAGSFAKTSMREILKTVLSVGKRVAAPPHSYNTLLGISRFVRGLKGDEQILIFELGEYYPGDIIELCELVLPDWGVITGVNEAHLQRFKTIDKTVKTIFELADYLGKKPVYVNAESALAKASARPGHVLYSRESVGEWHVEDAKTDLTGTSFTLVKHGFRLELCSGLLGLHQVGPLALAVDIGMQLGLTSQQIQMGIQNTKPFKHRLNPRTTPDGVTTLDDSYNGNPEGVKALIEFLGSITGRRRLYVTPGLVEMGSRTQAVHLEIGRQLAKAQIEKVVLIRNSATPFIAQGLKEAGYQGEIIWFEEALSAFSALTHMTVSGDVVLLQNDWSDSYK